MAEKYKNALWIRGTVRKITQDAVYIGCRIHGKVMRSKVGFDKKRRPEEEWKIIENSPKTKQVFTEAAETSESISAKRKKVENRMERLLTDLTERMIDRNEYEYMKAKYSQQLKDLLDAEEKAAARKNAVQKKLSVTQEWICNMKEYQSLPTLTPEILKLLIKEIRVHSNRSITIVFNFIDPYRSISELQNCVKEVRQVG